MKLRARVTELNIFDKTEYDKLHLPYYVGYEKNVEISGEIGKVIGSYACTNVFCVKWEYASFFYNIEDCPRCGKTHLQLAYREFTRKIEGLEDWEYYAICPVTQEPILGRISEY